jgi:hypothetical protein
VEGSNWLVSICPTSLGKGLHDAPREAEIDPINVHHPVAFAVYGVLGKMLQNSRSRRSDINSRVSQLAGSAFREWWNRDEIAKNHREIALTDSEMEKISAQIELLGSELMQSSRVYYNGKEQTRNAPLGAIGPQ